MSFFHRFFSNAALERQLESTHQLQRELDRHMGRVKGAGDLMDEANQRAFYLQKELNWRIENKPNLWVLLTAKRNFPKFKE